MKNQRIYCRLVELSLAGKNSNNYRSLPPRAVRINRIGGQCVFRLLDRTDRFFYDFYNIIDFQKHVAAGRQVQCRKHRNTACCPFGKKLITPSADGRCADACTFAAEWAFAGVSPVPERSKFTYKLLSNGRGVGHNTRTHTRPRVYVMECALPLFLFRYCTFARP